MYTIKWYWKKSKHVCDSLQLSCCCRSLALHRGLTSWLPKFQLSEYMEPVGIGWRGGALSFRTRLPFTCSTSVQEAKKHGQVEKKVSLTLLLFYFLTIVTERERGESEWEFLSSVIFFSVTKCKFWSIKQADISVQMFLVPLLRCTGELFLLLCYAVEKFIRLISTFSCCSIQVCPASRVFCTEPHMGVMKNLRGDCS